MNKIVKLSALGCTAAALILTFGSGAEAHKRGGFGPGPTFDQLDTNADGFITTEEMANLRVMRFKNGDRNSDGALTQDEMRASMVARMTAAGKEIDEAKMNKRLGWMFRAMDENGDGKIELSEIPDRPAGKFLKRIDTDSDGKVSKAEYDAMKEKRSRKHNDG